MKKIVSVFLVFSNIIALFIICFPLQSFALPSTQTGTMLSAQTVYCLPGGGMTIGSVSYNETVQVYWKEGAYCYIEYVVSSGNYSGYKRGYIPASQVLVAQPVGGNGYPQYAARVPSSKAVYNRSTTASMTIGTVYASDDITIMQDDGMWFYIEYPLDNGGHKRGYIQRSDIVQPQGSVEAVSFSRVVGWAWDPVNPNRTLDVHVYIRNESTGVDLGYVTTANIQRSDLAAAGYGNGCHGFEFAIDWNDYAPGTYTVRAYAIAGVNPQIGILSYTTTNRKAAYFMTGRPWPNNISNYSASVISQTISEYQSLGFTGAFGGTSPYYADNQTSPNALAYLQISAFISFHGHGNAGVLSMKRSSGYSDYLYSAVHGNGGNSNYNYNSIDTISNNSLNKIDVVAFLSCYSAIAPDGAGERSLTQICIEKGAKFAIGFINEVIGAEYFYSQFVNKLDTLNCYDAFQQTKTEAVNSAIALGNNSPYGTSGAGAVCLRNYMI